MQHTHTQIHTHLGTQLNSMFVESRPLNDTRLDLSIHVGKEMLG
jgi:hypothetical protein